VEANVKEILTVLPLLVALFLALEVGYRGGRKDSKEAGGAVVAQIGVIQAALLGLLGLLLAFSFAAAGTRFMERQDLIVQEANAIGTATLRSDLIAEPFRSDLHAALKSYTALRLSSAARIGTDLDPELLAQMERHQELMWRAATAGVEARPEAMLAVLDPVNAVIDVHSSRLAARRKHLPVLVLTLLVSCSVLSVGVIGYGCGLSRQRHLIMTGSLALLVGAALWITIDLDRPRQGWIRLSDAPLQALKFDAP
jgi:hypothetical protein